MEKDLVVRKNAWNEIAELNERAAKHQEKLDGEKAERLCKIAKKCREKGGE